MFPFFFFVNKFIYSLTIEFNGLLKHELNNKLFIGMNIIIKNEEIIDLESQQGRFFCYL